MTLKFDDIRTGQLKNFQVSLRLRANERFSLLNSGSMYWLQIRECIVLLRSLLIGFLQGRQHTAASLILAGPVVFVSCPREFESPQEFMSNSFLAGSLSQRVLQSMTGASPFARHLLTKESHGSSTQISRP